MHSVGQDLVGAAVYVCVLESCFHDHTILIKKNFTKEIQDLIFLSVEFNKVLSNYK